MTWSVSSFGKPTAVKTVLAKQFESARLSTKSMPHENAAVGYVENIVNGELDFLAAHSPDAVVKVEAGGSAYVSSGGAGSTQISLNVLPMHGFVE